MTALQTERVDGWFRIYSEGIESIFMSGVDEGITTGPGDTPANKQFFPRILNPENFSIKRAPTVWMEGNTQNQGAAFGTLEIDNRDGAYDFMLGADLRDTEVIIRLPTAAMLTNEEMADAFVMATGVIDNVESDNEDVISVRFKDTLARLDKTLPVKSYPAFADEGAAGVMIPLTFGPFRNRGMILVDSASRTYGIHDANIPNIVKVADMAAPLDPHATPPQYEPALNGAGVALETDPVGLVTADGSSYGSQATIAGIDDVLAGAGDFTGTWTGSPLVPPGWTFSHNTGSTIQKRTNPPDTELGALNGVFIRTIQPFQPGSHSGDYLEIANVLEPNKTYRVIFSLYDVKYEQPFFSGGRLGGVVVAMGLTATPADYITGTVSPLATPAFKAQNYSFEFTVPAGSSNRNLYFLVVPSAGNADNTASGAGSAVIFGVKLEEVGQFVDAPLTPIPLENYMTEILVIRAMEDPSIFNSAEAIAVSSRPDGSRIPFACCFDNPPNILDCLRMALDCFNAVMFTDANNDIRFRKLVDPADPANRQTIKADFTPFNVVRPIQVSANTGQYLTTLFGARRNWKVFSASDFVTDTAVVPVDEKTRFSRNSQFWITASARPAAQYIGAISAPIFDTVLDEPDDVQNMAEEAVGIYSPKNYSDNTTSNGKCRYITFTVMYDDPNEVGVNIKAAVTDIQYGDIVRLDYPDHGINGVLGVVTAWEIFPFAGKITLTIFVKDKR